MSKQYGPGPFDYVPSGKRGEPITIFDGTDRYKDKAENAYLGLMFVLSPFVFLYMLAVHLWSYKTNSAAENGSSSMMLSIAFFCTLIMLAIYAVVGLIGAWLWYIW